MDTKIRDTRQELMNQLLDVVFKMRFVRYDHEKWLDRWFRATTNSEMNAISREIGTLGEKAQELQDELDRLNSLLRNSDREVGLY